MRQYVVHGDLDKCDLVLTGFEVVSIITGIGDVLTRELSNRWPVQSQTGITSSANPRVITIRTPAEIEETNPVYWEESSLVTVAFGAHAGSVRNSPSPESVADTGHTLERIKQRACYCELSQAIASQKTLF